MADSACQAVEASVELAVAMSPAVIEADFTELERRVDAIVERYGGLEFDPGDERQVKEAKETRAYLNSVVREIDARRKAVEAEYSRPLVEFKQRVGAVTDRVKAASAAIDAQVKEGERRYREAKRAQIEEHYGEYAPALVPVVPYGRLHDDRWLNKGCRLDRAFAELEERVNRAACDWETLKGMGLEFPDVAEQRFFETLDLGEAVSCSARMAEDLRRIEELRRQVEEPAEEAACGEPEPPAPPAPSERPVAAEARREPEPPAPEEGCPWVVVIDSATPGQAVALASALRSMGLSGRMLRGTLAQVGKEVANG